MRACASEPRMSCFARRLSKPTDAVKRLTCSSTGSLKRPDQSCGFLAMLGECSRRALRNYGQYKANHLPGLAAGFPQPRRHRARAGRRERHRAGRRTVRRAGSRASHRSLPADCRTGRAAAPRLPGGAVRALVAARAAAVLDRLRRGHGAGAPRDGGAARRRDGNRHGAAGRARTHAAPRGAHRRRAPGLFSAAGEGVFAGARRSAAAGAAGADPAAFPLQQPERGAGAHPARPEARRALAGGSRRPVPHPDVGRAPVRAPRGRDRAARRSRARAHRESLRRRAAAPRRQPHGAREHPRAPGPVLRRGSAHRDAHQRWPLPRGNRDTLSGGFPMSAVRIFIADDEAPARERLKELLSDIAAELPTEVVGEARHGLEAVERVPASGAQVLLLDIEMPGMGGLEVARHLAALEQPPRVVFVTAHDRHAVEAFELNALDYLLKPVRAERLAAALKKAAAAAAPGREQLARAAIAAREYLSIVERHRILLVPVRDIVFLAAEGPPDEPHWLVVLDGIVERLPVSRRQWPVLRELVADKP